jgi:cell wall-associated NlpC family hydrolase
VVAEAASWLGTKFKMNGALKGVGVDCGRFPHLVYFACGLNVPPLPPHWPRDFMLHRMAGGEPYIKLILTKLVEVKVPLPGDLAVFKPHLSNCYSHAGIVVQWPQIIHARGIGSYPKVEVCKYGDWPLDTCPVRFFSPFILDSLVHL